jgi:phage baseplate assembly protein W
MATPSATARSGAVRRPTYQDINGMFGVNSHDLVVTEARAINIQIRNVLLTPIGSEPFEPEFGSRVPFLLWDPLNAMTAWRLESQTYVALERWMPHLQVVRRLTKVIANNSEMAFDFQIAWLLPSNSISDTYLVRLRK